MSDPVDNTPMDAELPEMPPPTAHEPTAPLSSTKQTEETKDAQTNLDDLQLNLQNLTDRTLRFLANASNETLGACIVGLGAATYVVLGRVGLILIGIVGGVALHATWEGNLNDAGDSKAQNQEARRKERGVEVAHRLLQWRDTVHAQQETDSNEESNTQVKLYSGKTLDYSEFRPETAAALTELTDAVIRDYVKWWYSPILPNESSFPSSCRQTLTAFILSVSNHLSRKRPADTFLDFVTNSSSIMIVFFNELSAALAASPGTPVAEAIDTYLQTKPDSSLGHVLDTKHQAKKLEMVAEDLLQNYLEPKTYNCLPAHTFLKEILAKVVLEMTLAACSKPEWINGWIVYLLEEGEPELMNAIDAGLESSADQLKNIGSTAEKQQTPASASSADQQKSANHKRVVSKAQEAMDEAMQEAQRLSAMIAEEDAKRLKELRSASGTSLNDDQSESTTQGMVTPTSSQSEALVESDTPEPAISNASSLDSSHHAEVPLEQAVEEPPKQPFTSFDQLIPAQPPTALSPPPPEKPPPLTLHNCNITIFDDSVPGEKGVMKNKPTAEYLIQIEPVSHHHSGWMTARKFTDFETLHEVLRRIAPITGATGFMNAHAMLPAWKGYTKASLRGDLEKYLNDAVRFKSLAESEGMKRFLEKDVGLDRSPSASKGGFSGMWPGQTFENMGKGMIDVLTKAPKEVAGGGKALFGGVTGVLGNVASPLSGSRKNSNNVANSPVNPSRSSTSSTHPPATRHNRAESTVSELPTHIRTESVISSFTRRPSTDSIRNPNSPVIDQQPGPVAQMERRPSYQDGDGKRSGRSSIHGPSRSNSRAPSVRESMDLSSMGGDQIITLPPLPSEIPDDYIGSPTDPFHTRQESQTSTSSLSPKPSVPIKPQKSHTSLTSQETTVLIELFFAVINELYTLSSAWQIRRTLLNAAKTFLLRPGNPQLESIRQLMQSTVLDDNTTDAGIAYHVRKIRANSLPTEEELKSWPKEMGCEEKERLRVKARKLLVERGMPQALTSVMGQAASGEALGRVFDCLQVERVARGCVFGLLLQGLRGVTQ